MRDKTKPIRLSEHAKQPLQFRGGIEQEVTQTIRTETWGPAELGRLECRKDFIFHSEWNKKYYTTKQVRPIFVDESDEIIVVKEEKIFDALEWLAAMCSHVPNKGE